MAFVQNGVTDVMETVKPTKSGKPPPAPLNCVNGCQRFIKHRGLCTTCYHKASSEVKAKRITWEQLEAAGKALPSKWYKNGKPQ